MSESGLRQVLADGDLAALNSEQRYAYYQSVCESVGLNPLTRPLEYIELNGKLTLYAKRDATDQLRHKYQVSIEIIDRSTQEHVYIVRARATMPDGRADESLGAVSLEGLAGEALANALMKAETKAKRRVALSICGLGMLDETEVDSIPTIASEGQRSPRGRRVGPGAILQAWDARGHASRRTLYEYVTTTFGKRVIALSPEELEHVLAWIEHDETAVDAAAEEPSDVL
jgi:hypothetical protein